MAWEGVWFGLRRLPVRRGSNRETRGDAQTEQGQWWIAPDLRPVANPAPVAAGAMY